MLTAKHILEHALAYLEFQRARRNLCLRDYEVGTELLKRARAAVDSELSLLGYGNDLRNGLVE